ncbi:MAG: carboxymuconolactone decarboxylase family protein [Dehalococcoidia bacterium]
MTTNESRPSPLDAIRDVTPKLVELTGTVVFGDVWERPELSKRDRSLITVAALTALYRTDQLRGHVGRALDNGVTAEEIGEVITHMAFYAGWPTAVNAAQVAKQVFEGRGVLPRSTGDASAKE